MTLFLSRWSLERKFGVNLSCYLKGSQVECHYDLEKALWYASFQVASIMQRVVFFQILFSSHPNTVWEMTY